VAAAQKCGACLHTPPPFDRTYALFPYEFPITAMIIKLKFQRQLVYAKAFGEKLSDKIIHDWYAQKALPDRIMPVPLHPKRLRERGFNQALEIVRPVSKKLKMTLDIASSERVRYTVAQSSLSAFARKQNMANAFVAHRHYAGLTIAVVDDVMSTGSTVWEFCKLLKQRGAAQIDIWCCARNFG
jgi:ComF family protein